jgi:glycerol-3-phosphate O-acyltransferase 3/4
MNDFILLLASHPYAVVGQRHTGWVGFLQQYLLGCLHCLWFDRSAESEKKKTGAAMIAHVHSPANAGTPLLVFPEGTCVNNEYVVQVSGRDGKGIWPRPRPLAAHSHAAPPSPPVQFKKSMFELNVPINPIAIKYNKVFVDGYWNSRAESFAAHQFRIMTSWAMVVDIWFMDPVERLPGEAGADFARRVQRLIAARAGLKAVDWDGYIKYWRPSDKFLQARQATLAEEIIGALGIVDAPDGVQLGAARRAQQTPSTVSTNSSAPVSLRPSMSDGHGGGGGSDAVGAAVDAALEQLSNEAKEGTPT